MMSAQHGTVYLDENGNREAGKEPGPADRSDVNRIVADVASHGSGFRDLIHAVVQSDLFRNK
jgi:hypothetical protein